MTLKKIKIISFFSVFAFTFLLHYMYDLFPNFIFSIFFPVNESIWEHMKLLYSGFILFGIVEYFILKKYDIKVNNYLFSLFIISITSIIIYLIIYLPLYNVFKDNMVINILLLIFVIFIMELLSYRLLVSGRNKYPSILFVLLLVLGYVVFTTLTYFPLENYIFYDKSSNKYGVNIYK